MIFQASKKREWKKNLTYNPRQWHNSAGAEDSSSSSQSQGFDFDDFDEEEKTNVKPSTSSSSSSSTSLSSSSSSSQSSLSSKMNGRPGDHGRGGSGRGSSTSGAGGSSGGGGVVVELTRGVPSSAPIHRISRPTIPRPFTKEVTKPGRHAFADPVTSLKVQREHKV